MKMMRKWMLLISMLYFFAGCEKTEVERTEFLGAEELALKGAVKEKCATIQSGNIFTSSGDVVTVGYDEYGYNYQAQSFNGLSSNQSRPEEPSAEGYNLAMKWNDGWLSTTDCDGDGRLDRHYGFDSYIGSGAWLTNHMYGVYEEEDGTVCEWDYFIKIVAAPADAELIDGIWYYPDGSEIGPMIWGQFAIIQEVENDPCYGIEGMQYISPDHSGLEGW